MLKIAIDTNILFSAIAYGGKSRQLLSLAENNRIIIGITEWSISELKSVFMDKFGEDADKYIKQLEEWVYDYARLLPKPRNKDLNKYLGCVSDIWDIPIIASIHRWDPDYFVTGDKKINNERVRQLLNVVTLSEILSILRKEKAHVFQK